MDDMTPGELGRSLERLEAGQEKQGELLGKIHEQTMKTNGRVAMLEQASSGHDRELAKLNSAVFPRKAVMGAAPENQPAVSLQLSPKMWALLAGVASAFSLLVPTLLKLIEKWLGLE